MDKRFFLLLPLLPGCSAPAEPPSAIRETARIANPAMSEASGLARSYLSDNRLWLINDSGAPILHAIDMDGDAAGSVTLESASNLDWEAIASFELDDKSWLLVADTGDNEAARASSTLYVVEEPLLRGGEHVVRAPERAIHFRWPDGPRDCEAVAVDAASGLILLLSKRTIPAVLYTLPLSPPSAGALVATRLGVIESLAQPTAGDLERVVPEQNWHWQPTAMDIARDGATAVILTYGRLYRFERQGQVPWMEAFERATTVLDLGRIRNAEAAAFVDDQGSVLITVEAPHAPLYRVGAF